MKILVSLFLHQQLILPSCVSFLLSGIKLLVVTYSFVVVGFWLTVRLRLFHKLISHVLCPFFHCTSSAFLVTLQIFFCYLIVNLVVFFDGQKSFYFHVDKSINITPTGFCSFLWSHRANPPTSQGHKDILWHFSLVFPLFGDFIPNNLSFLFLHFNVLLLVYLLGAMPVPYCCFNNGFVLRLK